MTYPEDRDNGWKQALIPDGLEESKPQVKATALQEGPAAYQLVGRVTAYQGRDG